MVTGEVVMAVLHAVKMWGGMRMRGKRKADLDCNEFGSFIDCLLSNVIDQEECDFQSRR